MGCVHIQSDVNCGEKGGKTSQTIVNLVFFFMDKNVVIVNDVTYKHLPPNTREKSERILETRIKNVYSFCINVFIN